MINRLIPLSYQIVIWQILAHLLCIYAIFYLWLSPANIWWILPSFLMFVLMNGLGNSVGYHRLFSHNSFKTHEWWHNIILFFATIGATGPSITWVALHRQHHVAPDTDKDPHSPMHFGYLKVHFLSMFLPVDIRYAKDLLRNSNHKFQYHYYSEIILIFIFLIYACGAMNLLIFIWAIPAVLNWHAGSLVLSWQHRSGHPHNSTLLALISNGEGYHKYHHDNPRNSRFGKWDLGYAFVHMIKK